MASQNKKVPTPSSVLCPFFLHKACRYGDNCHYSHDITAPSDDICRYYQFGVCSYGLRCRYRHVRLNKPSSSSSSSSKTSPPNLSLSKLIEHPEIRSGQEALSQAASARSGAEVRASGKLPQMSMAEQKPGTFAEILRLRAEEDPHQRLCPYYEKNGLCDFGRGCPDIHGDYCEVCQEYALHPTDSRSRARHLKKCNDDFYIRMEEAFAEQRSVDKVCSICLENVLDKPNKAEARFGLLQSCDHVFCLTCIRRWRASSNNGELCNRVVKGCPQCRQTSDFVTPSPYWFENDEDKQRIIKGYRERISQIDCVHFNHGNGDCPFAGRCFYRHRDESGSDVKLGDPGRQKAMNADGELVETGVLGNLSTYIDDAVDSVWEQFGSMGLNDHEILNELLTANHGAHNPTASNRGPMPPHDRQSSTNNEI